VDLCEKTQNINRHPWELSRVKAIKKILRTFIRREHKKRILDIGCGDAFISRNLLQNKDIQSINCVDIKLNNGQISHLSSLTNKISFHNNYRELDSYNLVLLLDILEHIENDIFFLKNIVSKYTEQNGYMLITLPAFQALFGSHDYFLGHYRRYNLNQTERLLRNINLEIVASGFLFFSLLPPRFLMNIFEKCNLFPQKKNKGIGDWRKGPILTAFFKLIFQCDNYFLITLSKYGIKLPGLSLWILCKKSQ
jgi:2-polyprenyl-3-methyl-5-hydroxy-6-metoxy-1,4-benzoquinol methylase